MKIDRSTRFKRSYKKLPDKVRNDFDKKILVFFEDPFERSLKTHKLSGKLDTYYSFCLKGGFRVLFEFDEDKSVLLVNIGDHDEYKKWERD